MAQTILLFILQLSLCALNGKCATFLCIAWRKPLRMLLRIHPMTHYDTITTISEILALEIQLNWCLAKVYNKSHESQLL